MMTRRMMSNENLMKTLSDLKEQRALSDRLLEDRNSNEATIKRLKSSNKQLTNKLMVLRQEHDSLLLEYDSQRQVIEGFNTSCLEHEAALDRIKLLEQQLRETTSELNSLQDFISETEQANALSLHEELAVENNNIIFNGRKNFKKYTRLSKFLEKKSKILRKMKSFKNLSNYRKDKIRMAKCIEDLQSDLIISNEKFMDTDKQLKELEIATQELLQLVSENNDMTSLLLKEDLDDLNKETLSEPSAKLSYSDVLQSSPPKDKISNSSIVFQVNGDQSIPKRKTLVFSDDIGRGFGQLLNNQLQQNVTNYCYPNASLNDIINKIGNEKLDQYTSIVIMIGNSCNLRKSNINYNIDLLLTLNSKYGCRFYLCAFPYCTNKYNNYNKYVYNINLHLYNLTFRHSDAIAFFDLNKFIAYFQLHESRMYLPQRYLRQVATLLAFNIHDEVIGNITNSFNDNATNFNFTSSDSEAVSSHLNC